MRYKVTRYSYDEGNKKAMVRKLDAYQARVESGVLLFHDGVGTLLKAINSDQWDHVKRVDDAT